MTKVSEIENDNIIKVCNTCNYFDVSIELICQFTAKNKNSKNAKPSLVELFFVEVK